MKVHPLLIAPMLEFSPIEISLLLGGNQFRGEYSFWGKVTSTKDDGIIYPETIGSNKFKDSSISVGSISYSEKLKQLLIGSSIDCYAEIPLAHRTRITSIEQGYARFECDDEYVDAEFLPRHDKVSIAMRRRRQAMEVFLHQKIHSMTRKILDRLSVNAIADMDLKALLSHESGINLDGKAFGKDEAISKIVIPCGGSAPDVHFENASIKASAVSVQGKYPESIRQTLPDADATRIIDHWILEDMKIGRISQNNKTMRVTFKSGERTLSYAEDNPEKTMEILQNLKRRENRHTPQSVKKWQAILAEKDSDRIADPKDRFETIHFYRKTSGEDRKTRTRVSAEYIEKIRCQR